LVYVTRELSTCEQDPAFGDVREHGRLGRRKVGMMYSTDAAAEQETPLRPLIVELSPKFEYISSYALYEYAPYGRAPSPV
jgi:hypothetical protein